MSQDLFGQPIDWGKMPPREAATQLYTLADREPVGSIERARLNGLAGHYAAKARYAAARDAARAERQARWAAEHRIFLCRVNDRAIS